MRRVKSPEQLKAWRLAHAERCRAIALAATEHESEMYDWMVREMKAGRQGDTFICPDGKPRKLPPHLLLHRTFLASSTEYKRVSVKPGDWL